MSDSTAEYLIELAKHQNGIASVAVSDGHVFLIQKDALERLLKAANDSDKEHVLVFVKHPVKQPAS